MAQERMDDWMEYARELARAERELRIERWVFISIECKDEAGNPVRLHFIDIIKIAISSINNIPNFSQFGAIHLVKSILLYCNT